MTCWINANSNPPKPPTLEDLGYVQVVRCKDCRYGSLWSEENVIVCDKLSKTRDENWFCADGECKTEED